MRVCVYMHMHVHMCVCMCVCVHACMFVCVWQPFTGMLVCYSVLFSCALKENFHFNLYKGSQVSDTAFQRDPCFHF